MPPAYAIKVLSRHDADDGIGGSTDTWTEEGTIYGYIDLITGTDLPTGGTTDNAFINNSTHIAVIPDAGGHAVTDNDMLKGPNGQVYDVTFVDDPLQIGHHLEIYLRVGGGTSELPGQ